MSLVEGGGEAAVGVLASAKYGKDKVRVFRVVRDATSKVHDVVEYNVTVMLEGAIETRCGPRCIVDCYLNLVGNSYTQADNTVVVATDSSAPFPTISHDHYDISNQTNRHINKLKHSEEHR
jgi:urate oxidase